MNYKLIIVILVSLISFTLQAKPKKKITLVQPQSFEEITYTQDPFTVTRYSLDEAEITSYVADGIQAPLPFRVIRGELTDHEFRETLIFITDNLSEAYND